MCHHHLRTVSKLATGLVPLGLVISAALIAGCDSAPDPNSPAAKAQSDATKATIQKTDDSIAEQLKKKGGKNAVAPKNIKGGINVKTPE